LPKFSQGAIQHSPQFEEPRRDTPGPGFDFTVRFGVNYSQEEENKKKRKLCTVQTKAAKHGDTATLP
jgi:hypothetical protein